MEIEELIQKAEKGDPDSQFQLGLKYQSGDGVTKDYSKAVEWYKKSAEQENVGAQYNLGFYYQFGMGVKVDNSKAFEFYKKALDQGYEGAEIGLQFVAKKLGISFNFKKYLREKEKKVINLTKLAEQGDASAQYNLGVCYEQGNGIAKDIYKALEWYKKSAEQGNENAKKALEKYQGISEVPTEIL